MRAMVLEKPAHAADVVLRRVTTPKVKPGWTLVHVRGFGLNHSEQVLRLGEIENDYIKHPIIPGIELVGEVADPSDSGLAGGEKVCALMGGMGRSWDGSYAEYCLVRNDRVFTIPDTAQELPWTTLTAIPETFYTAWGSMFEGLRLNPGDDLLIRGASSSLGYASLQIADALDCKTIAVTHRGQYRELLRRFGAHDVIIDKRGSLSGAGIEVGKILEIVGAGTLRDSLKLLSPGGICCQVGILGGTEHLRDFDPIKDIPNGRYLTGFFSNYPTQQTMGDIYEFVVEHAIVPFIAKVFPFDELMEAIAYQDEGGFQGKIVVVNEKG